MLSAWYGHHRPRPNPPKGKKAHTQGFGLRRCLRHGGGEATQSTCKQCGGPVRCRRRSGLATWCDGSPLAGAVAAAVANRCCAGRAGCTGRLGRGHRRGAGAAARHPHCRNRRIDQVYRRRRAGIAPATRIRSAGPPTATYEPTAQRGESVRARASEGSAPPSVPRFASSSVN